MFKGVMFYLKSTYADTVWEFRLYPEAQSVEGLGDKPEGRVFDSLPAVLWPSIRPSL